jgi:hypothetical protein
MAICRRLNNDNLQLVRYEVLTAVKMSMFFWVEYGDSMFLRNVGIYLRVHTVSKSRRTMLTT